MAIKSSEEKIKSVLNKVKHYGKCYHFDVASVIYLKYGKPDIQEWIKLPNMIEFLAEHDSDIQYLWKKMDKVKITARYEDGLFKGVDLKNLETKNYCKNLLVRLYLTEILEGEEEEYDSLE